MANDQGGIYFFNLRKLIKNNNFTIIKFGVKSVILFIYNPNYFKILVSCLIRLFDFESLHDFHTSLEILLDFFSYSLTCFVTFTLTSIYKVE